MLNQDVRLYDIVVFGATGFTGRLVSSYLSNMQADEPIKWAIGGRSSTRLLELKKTLQLSEDVGVIVADSAEPSTLNALCEQTRGVIACAGPFSTMGMPMVDACVQQQTHYVDITGEPHFIKKVIDKHHRAAKETNVFILPGSGFDSVPSDLVNMALHQAVAADNTTQVHAVQTAFSTSGSPSRGTLDTICHAITQSGTDEQQQQEPHPHQLDPSDDTPSPTMVKEEPSFSMGVRWQEPLQSYVGPFVMAQSNEALVRRSNGLFGWSSSYTEMFYGSFTQCIASNLSLFSLFSLKVPGVMRFAKRYLFPTAGEGPSPEALAAGRTSVRGVALDASGDALAQLQLTFPFEGYAFTAISAVETLLAVLAGESRPGVTGGVLTPSYAVGDALLQRLKTTADVNITDHY